MSMQFAKAKATICGDKTAEGPRAKSGREQYFRGVGDGDSGGERFFQQAHHLGRGRAIPGELAARDGYQLDMIQAVPIEDGLS